MQAAIECTLLDLVRTVNRVTEDDRAVALVIASLVNSGRVRLRGKFAGARVRLPASLALWPASLWPALLGLRFTRS